MHRQYRTYGDIFARMTRTRLDNDSVFRSDEISDSRPYASRGVFGDAGRDAIFSLRFQHDLQPQCVCQFRQGFFNVAVHGDAMPTEAVPLVKQLTDITVHFAQ